MLTGCALASIINCVKVKGVNLETVKYDISVPKVKTRVGSALQSLLRTKSHTHAQGFSTIALGDVKPHWLVQPEADGHRVNFMVVGNKLLEKTSSVRITLFPRNVEKLFHNEQRT